MKNGAKVFVAGSRRLSRLDAEVRRRLDNIVEKHLAVLMGDANGADKAVQEYLNTKKYGEVTVFCMEGECRNNIGHWPTHDVQAARPSKRDFAYYSTKDRAMAEEADYGLMLWDGQSRGTLRNIIDLVHRGKTVVVYTAPDRSFHHLRRSPDLSRMLCHYNLSALHELEGEPAGAQAGGASSRRGGSALKPGFSKAHRKTIEGVS